MEKSRRIVAFIPVRGGSKSIPKKNIKKIAGKPLVYWVIDAALNSKVFDGIYISTDDEEIKNIVLKHSLADKLNVIDRGPATATDTASTESAMLEFALKYEFDEIALIQATSPLLEAIHLKEAFEKFSSDEQAESLLSLCRQERFIWKDEKGNCVPVNYDPMSRPRRQDFGGFLVENGSFYITSRKELLKSGNRLSGKITYYEMPSETYFELDEPSDWVIIENILENFKSNHCEEKSKNIKLFLTDVDGVLTDAGMYYSEKGDELKKFNTRDGKGLELLRGKSIKTGIVTSEITEIVKRRAEKLKIDFLYQGKKHGGKLDAAKDICRQLDISIDEVAYIGDDINCYELLSSVGVAACPSDANDEIKNIPNIIQLNKRGGEGVVREFIQLLLHSML